MRPRFPGMDPWLEHPGLWPGVHNRLIAAIADDLGPRLAPRYFVAVEQPRNGTTPTDGSPSPKRSRAGIHDTRQ